MKRFARPLAVIIGIVVLGSFASLIPQNSAGPAAGGPSVTIANPLPLPVRQINDPVGEPFQVVLCSSPNDTFCFSALGGVQAINVPANQRLVIEYITGFCLSPTANPLIQMGIGTVAGGQRAVFVFPLTASSPVGPSSSPDRFFWVDHSVRVYADPGTSVTPANFLSDRAQAFCRFTVSGQLVNVP